MNELMKMYEVWNEEKIENRAVIEAWNNLLEILYEICSEKDRENIADHVIEYGRQIEKDAFLSGYIAAFNLWVDIIRNPDLNIQH